MSGFQRADAVLVAGLGGSGTRVFSELLESMGLVGPALINRSKDDLILSQMMSDSEIRTAPNSGKLGRFLSEFEAYISGEQTDAQLDKWLLNLQRKQHPLLPKKRAEMLASFREWDEDRSGIRFYKEPNLHIFYPELLLHFSELKAIYVLRDGRYMARSKNTNQLERWGSYFGISTKEPLEDGLFRIWEIAGKRMIGWSQKIGTDRLLLLRLEDLLEKPETVAKNLFDWLDLNSSTRDRHPFRPTDSAPRSLPHPGKPEWQSALELFGYLTPR